MRKLVIKTIIKNFSAGGDDIGNGYMRYYMPNDSEYIEFRSFADKHQEAIKLCVERKAMKKDYTIVHKLYAKKLIPLLKKAPNKVLIGCLQSQACQRCYC